MKSHLLMVVYLCLLLVPLSSGLPAFTSTEARSVQTFGDPSESEVTGPDVLAGQTIDTPIENLAITRAENALPLLQEIAASSTVNVTGYTWHELLIHPARDSHAMVYDSARGKVILFGGYGGGFLSDTWSYDPVANVWTNLNPANPPSARYNHAMAYDSVGGKVILFGGQSSGYLDDTWSYDTVANNWTQQIPGSSPSARDVHAMVYDSVGGKVILFGGWDGSSYRNDTWSYDPVANSWTNLNPTNPPSARDRHAMVYDSARGKVILFGGYSVSSGYNIDTWSYDPVANSWTNLNPTNPPSARYRHAMVYDSARGKVILFGGYGPPSDRNDTWSYDPVANSWTNLNPANPPSTRDGHAMVYDSARGKVLLFGGYSDGYRNDTWSYDPVANSWTNLNPTNPPPTRYSHAMVYDFAWGKVILFGGYNGSYRNDTWAYDPAANSWIDLVPPNPPPARLDLGLVQISNQRMFLFGGYDDSYLSDRWLLNLPGGPSSLTLTSPNGGEQWGIGSTRTIAWTSQGVSSTVKIEINRNYPSGSWDTLFASAPNDGSEPWVVTSPASTTCRMRITSVSDPSVQDTSDGNFIVAATGLTLTSPNGGEQWEVGTGHAITWTSTNLSGNVRITITRHGASTYAETITASVPVSAGTFNWTVTGPASTTCRVRINSLDIPSVFDSSDSDFTIFGLSPTHTVTYSLQPNWNMISLPVTPASLNPQVVFGGLPSPWYLFEWDPLAGTYIGKESIVLDLKAGYWLKVPTAVTYPVSGLPNEAAQTGVDLGLNWNLIGVPYEGTIPWGAVRVSKDGGALVTLDVAIASDWIQGMFFHWNGSAYDMLTSGDSFQSLFGYWAKTKVVGLRLVFLKP